MTKKRYVFIGLSALFSLNVSAGFFDNFASDLNSFSNNLGLAIQGEQGNRESSDADAAGQNMQQAEKVQVAISTKSINVRLGPGTGFDRVGSFASGAEAVILESKNQWLKISNESVEGWVYEPLVVVTTKLRMNVSPATAKNAQEHRQRKGKGTVYYAGYSKSLKPVKDLYSTGELKKIDGFFQEREKEALEGKSIWDSVDKVGLLRWMERGTLFLDQGNRENAIKSLSNAEHVIEQRSHNSKLEDLLTWGAGTLLETATGMEEFVEYPGEGFEKVLMLNYKSIAYLLNGERKAYNVTRRAIEWQDMEKRKFDEERRNAESKLGDEKENSGKAEAEMQEDDWDATYQQYDGIAERVPSAYVNPFGYYVAGMVQDYESRKDRSLRDNARISYEKALALNPESAAIKKAVNDLKNKKLTNDVRLLHVIVADGFVPEKKVLEYNFAANGQLVPVKLPLYEPVASSVHRIEIQTTSGKKLATLSSIADIEAITMRHQKDTEAFRSLRVILSLARSVGVSNATKDIPIFGALINSKVNEMSAPDTRSWMSLPANILGARIVLKKNVQQFKIVSYDRKGRKLASQRVKLEKSSDNFVYARSVNKHLYVNTSDKLWTL